MKEFGSWKKSFRRTFGRSRGGKAQDELYNAKGNKQQEEGLSGLQTLPPDTSNAGSPGRMEAFFLAPGSEKEQDENTGAGSTCNTLAKADDTEAEAITPSPTKSQYRHSDFETSNLPMCSSPSDRPYSTSESGEYNDCHTQRAQSSQRQREKISVFRTAIDAGSSIRDALDFAISVGSANRFVPTALPRLRLPPLISSLEIIQARPRVANSSINVCMTEESPAFIPFHRPPRTISELDRVCVSNMTPVERKMYHRSLREWRSDLSIASQYKCGARAGGSVASHSITDGSTVRSIESGSASVLGYRQPSVFQDVLQQRIDELHGTQDTADNVESVLDTSKNSQKHGYRARWATWAGIARSGFISLCRRKRHESDLSLQPTVPTSMEDGIGDDSENIQWFQHVDALQPAPPRSHMSTKGELCHSTAAARTERTGHNACDAGGTDHQSVEEAVPVPPLRITSKKPRTATEKKERLQKLRERLASVPQPGTNVVEEGSASGNQIRKQEQETTAPQIAASSSLEELLVWTELVRKREAASLTAMEYKSEASLSHPIEASSHSSISSGGGQTPTTSPAEAQVASDKAQRMRSLQPAEWPRSSSQNTKLQTVLHRGQEKLEHVQSVAAVVRQDNNDLPLIQSKQGGVSTASRNRHIIMTLPNSLASSISQAVDFDSDPRLEDVRNRTRIMGLVHQDWLRGAAQQRTAQAPKQADNLSPLSGTIHVLGTSGAQAGRDRNQFPIHSQQ